MWHKWFESIGSGFHNHYYIIQSMCPEDDKKQWKLIRSNWLHHQTNFFPDTLLGMERMWGHKDVACECQEQTGNP